MADTNNFSQTTSFPPTRQYLLCLAAALIFLLTRYAWVPGGPTAALGIAIFLSCGFLWLTEALPLAITALLIPILAIFSGVMQPIEALSGFSHPLIFLFLGGFGIAATLSAQEIDRWMAHGLVKIAGGSFLLSYIMLCFAAAFVSMWISNTATAAMLLPVALGISEEIKSDCDAETRRRAGLLLLLGLAYSCSIGGIATIVGTPPSAIAATALDLDFREWLRYGGPAFLVLQPICLLILWLTWPIKKRLKITPTQHRFVWTKTRLATLVIFLLTAIAWLSSGYLSRLLGGVKNLDAAIALAALVSYAVVGLVTWKDIYDTTNWGVLLLFGGGITLSYIMEEKYTGASQFLAESLAQFTTGWPSILIIAAVVYMVVFLTELTSNTATTFLFVPLFITLAGQIGLPPQKLAVPVAFAASCAFMLPVATPPNALVYGTGAVPQKDMIKVGLRLNIILGALIILHAQWFM